MLKPVALFCSFALVLVVAPFVRAQTYECVFIWGDPHIRSQQRGYEDCQYSSPDWIQTFFHPRISIDSIFKDAFAGQKNPTVQKSFRIQFNRPGSLSQVYVATNPEYTLPSTFVSGSSIVAGWLRIYSYPTLNAAVIVDYSTASAILVTRWPGFWGLYNLFFFAKPAFIKTGGGLLVQGCPYSARYPWLPYNDNPGIGRKKRQVDECERLLENGQMLAMIGGDNVKEIVKQICSSDSEFITNNVQFMMQDGVALVETSDVIKKALANECAESDRDGTQTEPIKEETVQPRKDFIREK